MIVGTDLSLLQATPAAISALVPAPSPAQEIDPKIYRSFVILHLAGPLFGLPLCATLLMLDSVNGPIPYLLTASVCIFWMFPAIARVNLGLAAFLSVQLLTFVSLFGAFIYGGLNSPFTVWLIVAVLLSFLYLPKRILSCAGVMTLQGLIFAVAYQARPNESPLSQADLGLLFLISSLAAALYVSLIAAFYSSIKTEGSKLASILVRYEETASRARAGIAELECEERRTSDLIVRTSHELRTALDVVLGYSELLIEDAAAEEREADISRLNRVTAASRQVLALITEGDRLAEGGAGKAGASGAKDESGRTEAAPTPNLAAEPRRRLIIDANIARFALAAVAGLSAALLIPGSVAAPLQVLTLFVLVGVTLHLKRFVPPPNHVDALTGLPNRAAFCREIERRREPFSRTEAALLFADLDGFKEVNDSLGHDVGDQLLAEVAKRVANACPRGVMLARLGGDEFGAVAFGPSADAVILELAEKMLDVLVEPVRTDEHHLTIGVSIGLAHDHTGQVSAKELLRRSDVAMYRAKRDKRTPIQTFDIQMDEALNFRRTMRHDLAGALSGNELDLHLQPVVDARTGDVASVEALLRWSHPVLGPISPAKLVALAEESGQIVAIDEWVLDRALEYAKRLDGLPVAINVSPIQFRHPSFVQKIVDALEKHAVPPQLLRLEITEGVLVTHTRAAGRAIAELRDRGIRIALDDFGTGYSSLSYLKDFGFDILKVDRSFVTALDAGRQGAELLRAIVDLGHSLSMSVVAEGVETAEQAALVQLLNCDFIQGYYTGRPMPIDQLQVRLGEGCMKGKSPEPVAATHIRPV